MDEWVIKSEKETKLIFHSRLFNSKGWLEYYSVTAKARDFIATIQVENSLYGRPPSRLFSEISEKYSGWENEISWGALDGELNLSATCDKLGHVTLLAELNKFDAPPCWFATISLVLDLGMLEELASSATIFFNDN
jgi:Family of unknown function (DUF6228)